jgi:hypothetical protein
MRSLALKRRAKWWPMLIATSSRGRSIRVRQQLMPRNIMIADDDSPILMDFGSTIK